MPHLPEKETNAEPVEVGPEGCNAEAYIALAHHAALANVK